MQQTKTSVEFELESLNESDFLLSKKVSLMRTQRMLFFHRPPSKLEKHHGKWRASVKASHDATIG